jgi:hypothetical protein
MTLMLEDPVEIAFAVANRIRQLDQPVSPAPGRIWK